MWTRRFEAILAATISIAAMLVAAPALAEHPDRVTCQPIATCGDASTSPDSQECPDGHACVCVPSCPLCRDCATQVCVPVAIEQARHFQVPWQEEILRYVIHGVLHLSGMDDHTDSGYRRMKREEKRLLHRLAPGSGLPYSSNTGMSRSAAALRSASSNSRSSVWFTQ